LFIPNFFGVLFKEEGSDEDDPSFYSLIRQNLSLIMAPPEERFGSQPQIQWPENAELYQVCCNMLSNE
jgi:hypothetical protein